MPYFIISYGNVVKVSIEADDFAVAEGIRELLINIFKETDRRFLKRKCILIIINSGKEFHYNALSQSQWGFFDDVIILSSDFKIRMLCGIILKPSVFISLDLSVVEIKNMLINTLISSPRKVMIRRLTIDERKVLRLMEAGFGVEQISYFLNIPAKRVYHHFSRIRFKYHVRTNEEIMLKRRIARYFLSLPKPSCIHVVK